MPNLVPWQLLIYTAVMVVGVLIIVAIISKWPITLFPSKSTPATDDSARDAWKNEQFAVLGVGSYSFYVDSALPASEMCRCFARKLEEFSGTHPDLRIVEVQARGTHNCFFANIRVQPREATK